MRSMSAQPPTLLGPSQHRLRSSSTPLVRMCIVLFISGSPELLASQIQMTSACPFPDWVLLVPTSASQLVYQRLCYPVFGRASQIQITSAGTFPDWVLLVPTSATQLVYQRLCLGGHHRFKSTQHAHFLIVPTSAFRLVYQRLCLGGHHIFKSPQQVHSLIVPTSASQLVYQRLCYPVFGRASQIQITSTGTFPDWVLLVPTSASQLVYQRLCLGGHHRFK